MEAKLNPPDGISNFPAMRLHYMAVDDRYRGEDYGVDIMITILEHAYKFPLAVGCSVISVEALKSSINFYKKFDFILYGKFTLDGSKNS